MDNLYGRLKNNIIKSKSEILDKNDEIKSSYADMLKKNDDKMCIKKDPIVIVKPKDKNQNAEKTKMDIKNKINPNEIPVNGLFNSNNGAIIIKCKKKDDIAKVKNIVESDMGENYEARIPDSKNPRVKIVGLDEKPEDNVEIIEILNRQNDEFFGDGDIIKVVTVMQAKNRRGKIYYNLIIEVNAKTYNKIMSIEEPRINFNFNRCKVYDALYVKRCYKCCSLDGHSSKDCQKNAVCYKCSGNHKNDVCTADKLKCINCENAIKNLKLNLDSEHNKGIYGVIYKSPKQVKSNFLKIIDDIFEDTIDDRNFNFICGDFNIDLNKKSDYSDKLLKNFEQHNLIQIISEATRETDKTATLIDYVLTNKSSEIDYKMIETEKNK
jgi:hypothetical protein